MNAFEAGTRKNIPAVLIYARNRGRILMIHRNAPERAKSDEHAGKWNGLGGKCEPDESSWQSAAREFHEEAGLQIDPARFSALGTLQFPNFKPRKSEDWTVFVFAIELDDSQAERVASRNDEGSLHWIAESDVLQLNLWSGDRHFIPRVIAREAFSGTIWYRDGEVLQHEVRKF